MTATATPQGAAEPAPRPGPPPGLDLTGLQMTKAWLTRQADTILRMHEEIGDVATVTFFGGRGGVMTRSPADIEMIFKAPPEHVPTAAGGSPIGPFVGENSLLTLNGPQHLRHRRLLLPPFHGDRMRGYTDDIREIAASEIDGWHAGTTMRLQPRMQAITLEVILRIVFGVEDAARQDQLRRAIVRLLEYTGNKWLIGPTFIAAVRAGRLIGPVAKTAKEVDRLIYREIALRKKATDLESRPDVLSMLLLARDEDGEPMGEDELRDELVTLLFAGHETTASALSWVFERLVRHPAALARAVEAAEGDDPDGVLDATFQETLRLRPIVPVIARVPQVPMELSGYRVEEGKLVVISILGACRHPDRYERPDEFDPERFIGGKADAFTWIPFGGGVRRCPGAAFAKLEGREVMREILRRTRLEAVDPADEPMKRRNVTMVPGGGAAVRVIRVDPR